MFNIFKKKDLKFNVRLEPSNKEIVLKAGENLLTVALAQGIKWPKKGRVGRCETCNCKVLEGE